MWVKRRKKNLVLLSSPKESTVVDFGNGMSFDGEMKRNQVAEEKRKKAEYLYVPGKK